MQNQGELHIKLLGGFHLSYKGEPINITSSRLKQLLAYLLFHLELRHSREHIAFLFWPDSTEEQARTNLRNLIYQLRGTLPDADHFLAIDNTTLQWNTESAFSLDVTEFEYCITKSENHADPTQKIKFLKKAIYLYSGPLLPECYERWIEQPRHQLQRSYDEALKDLINLLEETGTLEDAIQVAQIRVAFDDLNENAWRELLQLQIKNNNHSSALQTYRECVKVLQGELDVDPSEETKQLYRQHLCNGSDAGNGYSKRNQDGNSNNTKSLSSENDSNLEEGAKIHNSSNKDGITDGNSEPGILKIVSNRPYLSSGILILLLAIVGILYLPDAPPPDISLAVLPIQSAPHDTLHQLVADGFTEVLSEKLSSTELYHSSFSVIPYHYINLYKITSSGEANRIFGVHFTITGSLQRFPPSLTLRLNDTRDGTVLDSINLEISSNNFISLQKNAVDAVLEMVDVKQDTAIKQAIAKDFPANPSAYNYYLRGTAYLQRTLSEEHIDYATMLFKRAIEEDGSFGLAYWALGKSYLYRHKELQDEKALERANIYLDKAEKRTGNQGKIKITRGFIHKEMGEYAKAINNFKEAVDLVPNKTTTFITYTNVAATYNEMGQLNLAEATYKEAITLKPDFWPAYHHLGYFYLKQNRHTDALKQYQHVIDLAPHISTGYTHTGAALSRKGDREKAEIMFEKAFAIDSSLATIANWAHIAYVQQRYADAAYYYKKLVELNPHYSPQWLWERLALACAMTPELKDKAQNYYKKAIEAAEETLIDNPDHAGLISKVGSFYSHIGDTTKALEYTNRAIELELYDMTVNLFAAITYENLGKREEALDQLSNALTVTGGGAMSSIQTSPILKGIMKDNRFKTMTGRDR
ncbi:tetratricopeptide repeat protein [Aliifodinibius sp. S!AR15-10]|uniref:BTAD domain-containing putative transcriptional regulator n=1 Tax=Aliifodinibius sp. S!AR15-10 TaxID=2950437 RepID=UPI00285FA872|nr:BTAD domain-containing putative transcriptional regulator [Aliifodinibius sp. S!AR15-10]MDR8389581.1 tetratricopeptide repeat protein [Aliifodinibius sp. S!AR15-10]